MATTAKFKKVVIYGVGLIGGSFALGLKAAGMVDEVVGIGRRLSSLQEAVQFGLIDRIADTTCSEVADADLVLVATPVGQMPEIFANIVPQLGTHTIVTDAGSTKGDVVAAARAAFGDKIAQFVPAHPIAGAENSGPSAARANLYQGRKVVITPLPENSAAAVASVKAAWEASGANLYELSPEKHDQVFAAVSHLPHLLSFALVHDLAVRDDAAIFFDFAASGFRDFTRIAASHPEMWRDICLANRLSLLDELGRYQAQLQELRLALQANDAQRLEAIFALARTARRDWGAGK